MGVKRTLTPFIKKNLLLLLLLLVLQIILGFIPARSYLLLRNTLHENGNWISTKTTLEKSVMGAFSYIFEQLALVGTHLNLGAWYGYQEVMYKNKLHLDSLEFDCMLEAGSYLNVIFNKQDDGFSGIRLSVNPLFKPIYFTASALGEFTKKVPIPRPELSPETWYHLKLSFEESRFSVFFDGTEIGTFDEDISTDQLVGFRGSYLVSFVDNVIIQPHNAKQIRETFDNQEHILRVTLLFIGIAGMFNLLLALFSSLIVKMKGQQVMFTVVLLNIVLVPLSSFVLGYLYVAGDYYPAFDERLAQEEAYLKNSFKKDVARDIANTYSRKPKNNVYRILFLGTSQTWGAGASKENETFVHLVENRLNETLHASGIHVECINGGIPAVDSSDVLSVYKHTWIHLEPHLVVINLANNDRRLPPFQINLNEIVSLSLAEGILPILVLEANSIEVGDPGLIMKHDVMKAIGAFKDIPVIDMHTYLLERYDVGFLWWDAIHLTSFGQQLVAQKLYQELLPIITTPTAQE